MYLWWTILIILHILVASSISSFCSMSAFPSSIDDLDISSTDINRSKFTIENHNELKKAFPQLDDTTIARYLIARNNDLAKATELLTKAQKWKAARYPVLKSDCLDEISIGKMYTHGVDKEGHPLLIFRSALHESKNRNLETMARMVLWTTEQALARLPSDKSQFTILFDRTDSGIANQDLEFVKSFAKLFQDQHPERLFRAIVYPSGMVFWSLWNIVKWFVDPNTRNKVAAVVYLAGVQEFVDDEHIPSRIVSTCQLLYCLRISLFLSLSFAFDRVASAPTSTTWTTSTILILLR